MTPRGAVAYAVAATNRDLVGSKFVPDPERGMHCPPPGSVSPAIIKAKIDWVLVSLVYKGHILDWELDEARLIVTRELRINPPLSRFPQ